MTAPSAGNSYQAIFQARGGSYNAANRLCPGARETERALLLHYLELQSGQLLCDAACGGGYLADGASRTLDPQRILCVDPSITLMRALDPRYPRLVAHLNRIPLRAMSVDRVACLTGLHHLPDKAAFFREAARILRPEGVFAVADVLWHTAPARFLNGPCDLYSGTGHDGTFLARGELENLMAGAGFVDIAERQESYSWQFPDRATLVSFCSQLFGLVRARPQDVEQAIESHLEPRLCPQGIEIPWTLAYARGRLPAAGRPA